MRLKKIFWAFVVCVPVFASSPLENCVREISNVVCSAPDQVKVGEACYTRLAAVVSPESFDPAFNKFLFRVTLPVGATTITHLQVGTKLYEVATQKDKVVVTFNRTALFEGTVKEIPLETSRWRPYVLTNRPGKTYEFLLNALPQSESVLEIVKGKQRLFAIVTTAVIAIGARVFSHWWMTPPAPPEVAKKDKAK